MIEQTYIGGVGPLGGTTLTGAAPTASIDLSVEVKSVHGPHVSEGNTLFVFAAGDEEFTVEFDFSDDDGVTYNRDGVMRYPVYAQQPRVFAMPCWGDHVRVTARRFEADAEVHVVASVR